MRSQYRDILGNHIAPKNPNQLPDVLAEHYGEWTCSTKKGREKIEYADVVATFDIETTSDYIYGRKIAYMYVWQFYIFDQVFIGRTWDQFREFIYTLEDYFGKHGACLPIYVHYLGFEFSFMEHVFEWKKIFAASAHMPYKAMTVNNKNADLPGVEFRDSLVLSGLPLSKLPTKTKKLEGDLDYSLRRNSRTPLTREEIGYCVNDVVVLAEYITNKLGDDNMATIPMTRTGYVRRDVRNRMRREGDSVEFMTMTPEQYIKLRKVYAGGYTHAAAHTSGRTISLIRSLDITSSYPTVIVAEDKYPMSSFSPRDPKDTEDLLWYLQNMCCMFRLDIYDMKRKDEMPDDIISESKCEVIDNAEVNNGRVYSADHIAIYANEVDLAAYKRVYNGDFRISELEVAAAGRLPASLVEAVLDYYMLKTTLKGVKGKEDQYARFKEWVNAIYGMMVTDPIKGEWSIDENGEWKEKIPDDMEKALDKYNKGKNRFLYYPWGVWVTSYARNNLYSMMWKCGYDYHYSDTDSLKISNYNLHRKQFNDYNRRICSKIRIACKDLGIDPAKAIPTDKKGRTHPLGVWSDEGEYFSFKTLGAKRYLTEGIDDDGDYDMSPTVAGAPKKALKKYLWGLENPFEEFKDDLKVPAEKSGKNLHTHITEPYMGFVIDYLGNRDYIYAPSGTHLEPMEVTMTISEGYAMFLMLHGEDMVDIVI